MNYPAVATDIIKEAEKRAAETKEIEEAHKDEMWEDIQNPEEEKDNLERLYGTPPRMRKNNFSPKMFDAVSKRSSFVGAISTSLEDLITSKSKLVKRENSVGLLKENPHESFKKLKKLLPGKHNSNNNLLSTVDQKIEKIRRRSQFIVEEEMKDEKFFKGRNSFKDDKN